MQITPLSTWDVAAQAGRARRDPHPFVNPNATIPVVLRIQARLTLLWSGPPSARTAAFIHWQSWLQGQLRGATPDIGPQSAFQTSDAWRAMDTATTMFRNAVHSTLLSLLLALCVLLLATHNAAVSVLATLCISTVVLVFMAAMQLLGWTIGAPSCHTGCPLVAPD